MLWQWKRSRGRDRYFERPERLRLGAERTLPPDREAPPEDREGAERMLGALLRDGLDMRGALRTGAGLEPRL